METRGRVLACITAMATLGLPALGVAAQCPADDHKGTETCIPANSAANTGLNRPPGAHDDVSSGYAPGDLWQAGGQVWRATALTPGAAQWTAVPTPHAPADTFGPHAVFAGGPTRMVSTYSGPAVDIETTAGGQTVATTLNIRPDGMLDTATLKRVLAARDAGTFATVTRVYDQTGHGNHIVATPGHHVVHIGAVQVSGQETLSWGEINGPGGFVLPQTLKVPTNSFFFGTTGTYASSNSGYSAFPVPLMLGQQGQEFKEFMGSYTLDGFVHVADMRSPDQRTDLIISNDPAAFGLSATPAGYRLENGNNHVVLGGALSGGAFSGGYIGYNADGGNWFEQGRNTGQWTGIVIADQAATAGQEQDFEAAAAVAGNHMPQLRDTVVAIGDSRTEGFGLSDGTNWPYLMQRYARYKSYNFAVSGATTKQMLDMVPAAEALARHPGRKVAVVFGGFNDHLHQIGTGETVHNLGQITSRLKKAGYHVAFLDETMTQGAPRKALDNAVEDGKIPADLELDLFSTGEPLSDVLDQTKWLADTTHPNQAGHDIIARNVWQNIANFLGQ
ncbi:SGNH/GDSL hydrolase family protein [Komagataeibacter xylinus]|uniref:SGNH/GDSL hydrolase family protein n=1 Tax=Komagataeibacter xylinus TaxID=28448 RepID=UPI000FDF6ACB|nr:GDSL-type esterase/lipase family protein [Komagataeibacter xylinus]AZV37916.1 SGNH/GDSL hydrolase family protein [Komagataeibacter xylinus]